MSPSRPEMVVASHDHGYTFRRAGPGDAASCASLIFASGPAEFAYLLGVDEVRSIAFLKHAFAMTSGRFSYRHHHVAVAGDGRICSVLATHTRLQLWCGDFVFAAQLLRRYGVVAATRTLIRGSVLSSTLVRPNARDILISHCATHARARSQGVFRRLFRHVMTSCCVRQKAWLNVLDSNVDARRLYVRLGFVDSPAYPRRSARLPALLNARSMFWSPAPQENA